MQQPETLYAKSGDAYIAYQVVGGGPIDLLYIFGIPLSIDSIWDREEPARFFSSLASFSRLILFDRRGVGLSDPITPTSEPMIEEAVDDALAVLDAIGSEKAAVFGTEVVGGLLAMFFAAIRPERISHLIVANSNARARRPWGEPTTGSDLAPSPALKAAPSMATDASFNDWLSRSIRRAITPGVRRLWRTAFDDVDMRGILPSIRVPTLVLQRRAVSRSISTAAGREIADAIAGARFVELEGADAFLFVGDSSAVVGEVQEFVTGVRPTLVADRVLATIMFSDIVSSTEGVVDAGDRRWAEKLQAHDNAVQRQLERFDGRHVNTTGDGFLATFDGPARAIHCADAIHDVLHGLGLQVRIGIHTGEVERRQDDVAGVAVHIAQRISDLAEPGHTMVSRTVTELVAGSGISFGNRGEHELKGVPGGFHVYEVTR